jgi:hypothetical protein
LTGRRQPGSLGRLAGVPRGSFCRGLVPVEVQEGCCVKEARFLPDLNTLINRIAVFFNRDPVFMFKSNPDFLLWLGIGISSPGREEGNGSSISRK